MNEPLNWNRVNVDWLLRMFFLTANNMKTPSNLDQIVDFIYDQHLEGFEGTVTYPMVLDGLVAWIENQTKYFD
jgi:CO dehydrogenase/acetyl-CoA synthase epsilon subunit